MQKEDGVWKEGRHLPETQRETENKSTLLIRDRKGGEEGKGIGSGLARRYELQSRKAVSNKWGRWTSPALPFQDYSKNLTVRRENGFLKNLACFEQKLGTKPREEKGSPRENDAHTSLPGKQRRGDIRGRHSGALKDREP